MARNGVAAAEVGSIERERVLNLDVQVGLVGVAESPIWPMTGPSRT
jgi:hypothetical protein